MRLKPLATLISLGLATSAFQAQAMDERWYVAPSASYVIPDNRPADEGWGLGLAFGKALTEKWNAEFGVRYNTMDLDGVGTGDIEQYSLGLDGLYFFNRNPGFAPYAVMGLGYLRSETNADNDNSLMGNVGLGFMKQLSDDISLRADARYRLATNDLAGTTKSEFGDWLINVGLNIALGPKPQPAPAPAPVPAPEPAPVAAPAPAPAPVKAAEPAPAPAPAPAAKTGAAGELEKAKPGDVVVILHGVNFEFDSAKLRPDAVQILNDAVDVLKRRQDIKVDIVGHTCSVGSEAYNQSLSERRAKAVYDYFTGHGIAAERLSSKGMGESQPAFSNATREGRAKNRRVELHVK